MQKIPLEKTLENAPQKSEEQLLQEAKDMIQEIQKRTDLLSVLRRAYKKELDNDAFKIFEELFGKSYSHDRPSETSIQSLRFLIDHGNRLQYLLKELRTPFRIQEIDALLRGLPNGTDDEQIMKAYKEILFEDQSGEHPILPIGKPKSRQKVLMDLIRVIPRIVTLLKELVEIQHKKEKSLRVEEEKERERIRNELLKTVREQISIPLSEKAQEQDELAGIDSAHKAMMVALMGENEEIDAYFKTFFQPETLNKYRSFDALMRELSSNTQPWEEIIAHRDMISERQLDLEGMKALYQQWEKDMKTLEAHKEAMKVRTKLLARDAELFGGRILEDVRFPTEEEERKMKQITWGKFAEKIMSYILAEAAYDNKKNIKVIRVGKKIDLRGVDLFIERKLKDGWKLFGIDFKMKTEPKKGEIEEEGEDGKKDQEIATYNGEILRTVAKELHFNPQIARKVSNSKLFMERTPELEVVEVEDLPRREFYNDLSLDFRVELLKEIYERITSGNMPDINDQKFFRKAYDDTYQNLLNWKGRDFLKKYTKQSHEIINFAFGRAA